MTDLIPGTLNNFNAKGEWMACNEDVNSKVLFSIGKIWASTDTNFKALSFGVGNVLKDSNLDVMLVKRNGLFHKVLVNIFF